MNPYNVNSKHRPLALALERMADAVLSNDEPQGELFDQLLDKLVEEGYLDYEDPDRDMAVYRKL